MANFKRQNKIWQAVSIAAFETEQTPFDGMRLVVNGKLMRWWAGPRFVFPGLFTTPEGLWIPAEYWGGTVQAVYDATTAWDLAGGANVAWGWTWNFDGALGTIAVAAGETTLDTVAGGAGGTSWLENAIIGALTGHSLVIVRGETTAAVGNLGGQVALNDAVSGVQQILYTTDGGVGWHVFSQAATGTQYYSRAAGRWRLQLDLDGLTDTEAQIVMRDYDTQVVGVGAKVADLGNAGVDRFRIGDTVANAFLMTQILTGNPAIVIVSAP